MIRTVLAIAETIKLIATRTYFVVAVLGLVLPSAAANATIIDVTLSKNDAEILWVSNPAAGNDSLIDQAITFTGLNPNATSNATVTFGVRGDFNGTSESVVLSVDGFGFGTWLDDDLTNDTITGPPSDVGNQYQSIITGQAIIPLPTLTALLSDVTLAFLFDYDDTVGNLTGSFVGLDLAQVRVQYDASSVIPEPSTLALFATGLAGLGFVGWRRRKRLQLKAA